MRKRMLALVLTALMLLSSGCGRNQQLEEYRSRYQRMTQHPAQTGETEPGGTSAGDEAQPQAFEEMQWVYKPDGKGSMICTITNVRAVKNERDFDGNCFDYDGSIILTNPEYTEERFQQDREKYPPLLIFHYPDSVDENGDLLDGCLILVDLTVENIDGRNEYLNHQTGEMVPWDGDPYIFRASSFIFLANRTPKEYTPCKVATYYSDMWNLGDKTNPEENPMKFRLEPGKTVSFQIGFLTNEVPTTWQLEDDLFLSTSQNIDIGILFPLDLEAPEA